MGKSTQVAATTAPNTAIDLATQQPELEALAQRVLSTAKAMGADSAEVSCSLETGLSVSARNGDIETLEYQRDRGIGITVYFAGNPIDTASGLRQGHASTSDFRDSAIQSAVQAACDIAKATQPDPHAGLADAALMAADFHDLDLYHPWSISPDEAIELAIEIDNTARLYDAKISNGDGASVDTGAGLSVKANSHGFVGTKSGTRHSLSCSVIAEVGDDMQRDYEYSSSRLPNSLLPAKAIGEQAAENALSRLGAQHVATCQAPVIFRADVARGVIGHALSAISGGALYRDASFLKDQIGQPIFSPEIHLLERPHLQQGNASSTFDADGLATPAERHLITDGILNTYLLSVYSARKLNMSPTAHGGGARNLIIPATVNYGLADILASVGTGFLVTELMGQGVNTVTGDYSRGASGFWIENGEIAYPIKEATIAGKLQDMYQRIVMIGSDMDQRGNLHMGSMVIEGMTIAGNG